MNSRSERGRLYNAGSQTFKREWMSLSAGVHAMRVAAAGESRLTRLV